MKYIPINGLKFNISFKLHWFGLNNKGVVEFDFITKDYFEKNHGYLCNYSDVDQFDSLVGYISQYHNAYEIQAVKCYILWTECRIPICVLKIFQRQIKI